MTITLESVSKRFQKHWIFQNISHCFHAGEPCALLGANGSGKSTLLRIIAGMQTPSKGVVAYSGNGIHAGRIYKSVSFAAPGQELVEEMTLTEFFKFHFSFRPTLNNLEISDIITMTGLAAARNKYIRDFSSGMKQRVKLAQAIFADTPILLLDEPCTNLDQAGFGQYRDWMEQYTAGRLVIVASNDVNEYFFCRKTLSLEDFK